MEMQVQDLPPAPVEPSECRWVYIYEGPKVANSNLPWEER